MEKILENFLFEYNVIFTLKYVFEVFVPLLGAFAKFRKVTISFVMSVRPSVRPFVCLHGTIRLPLGGFSLNWIVEFFLKTVEQSQVSLKSDKHKRVHYMKTNTPFSSYRVQFFLEW
jgi:hypothetical protein